MGREVPIAPVSAPRLWSSALVDGYVAAVVPPGLDPKDDRRAREGASAFLEVLLRHVDGDERAVGEVRAILGAVAAEVIGEGDDPGVLLDRFDAGRHVILRAASDAGATAAQVIAVDDRLRTTQSAARAAVRDAVADFERSIDSAVAEVTRAIEGGRTPEDVMRVAAGALCSVVAADRARVWLDVGVGRLELVASAGGESPMGFYVSSERGVLAEIMRGATPVQQCPVDPEEWQAAVPNLPIPASALFVPLAAAGAPFGLVYALRDRQVPFNDAAVQRAARFVERVEPALAWAMQLRSVHRWAEASQDFLRITTHELRRPLTVLRGYLEMLDEVGPEEGAMMRERMARAADQLAELLTGVTDTITLEDPARTLTLARITVGELFDIVLRGARDEADQQGVTLITSVDDESMEIQCDVDNVVHALANLLSNAFRHTGGERRVWLHASSDSSRLVRFTVRDEGDGIVSGEENRIFQKYYRTEALRRSGSPGSGLGLYFVRLVAERHGGRVAAQNVAGDGASFVLELPLEPGIIAWSI